MASSSGQAIFEFTYVFTWFLLALTSLLLKILVSVTALYHFGSMALFSGQHGTLPCLSILHVKDADQPAVSRHSRGTGYGISEIFGLVHALKGL